MDKRIHRLLAFAILVVFAPVTFAASVATVEDVTVVAGSEGFLEVFVDLDPVPSPLPLVTGFQLKLQLDSGGSGISFVSAGPEFVLSTVDHSQLLDTVGIVDGGSTATEVTTARVLFSGSVELFDEAGLARIKFNVPSDTPAGEYRVHLVTELEDPNFGLMMTDQTFQAFPLRSADGKITVVANVVPVPAALWMGAITLAGTALTRLVRQRRPTPEI